jgi:hypothetical protein
MLGVGLLHQCELRYDIVDDLPPLESPVQYEFNSNSVRRIWNIPAAVGIATRFAFYAKAPNGDELALYVVELGGKHGRDLKMICHKTGSIPIDLIEEEIDRVRPQQDLDI